MVLHATLQVIDGKFVATCLDFEAYGEGTTRTQALAALRSAVAEREEPEAVAPPEHAPPPTVEIVVIDDETEPAEEVASTSNPH
jgi:hypothetical protein